MKPELCVLCGRRKRELGKAVCEECSQEVLEALQAHLHPRSKWGYYIAESLIEFLDSLPGLKHEFAIDTLDERDRAELRWLRGTYLTLCEVCGSEELARHLLENYGTIYRRFL